MTERMTEWEANQNKSKFDEVFDKNLQNFETNYVEVAEQVDVLTWIIDSSELSWEAKKNLKKYLKKCKYLPSTEVMEEMVKSNTCFFLLPEYNYRLDEFNDVKTIKKISEILAIFDNSQKNDIIRSVFKGQIDSRDLDTIYNRFQKWNFSSTTNKQMFINAIKLTIDEINK